MMHSSGIWCRENAESCFSAVMPRFKRGIQYAETVIGIEMPVVTGSPGPAYADGFGAATSSRARRSLSEGGKPGDDR
jgi:hypothetical protein